MNTETRRAFDERRIDALEELLFMLAHSLAVEAPQVGQPMAHRLKLIAEQGSVSDETRRLFQRVVRTLNTC